MKRKGERLNGLKKTEDFKFERKIKFLEAEKEVIALKEKAELAVIDKKAKQEKSLLEKKIELQDKILAEMQVRAQMDKQKWQDGESKHYSICFLKFVLSYKQFT